LLADVVPFSWVDGPGNRFAVFLQGCNIDCLACHNPHTIPRTSVHATDIGVDDLMARVRPLAPFLSGVTVSGGEATQQSEFVAAWFDAIRADPATSRLTRFVDSNGVVTPTTWDRLLAWTDGVMLDLKCLDDGVHRRMTGEGNALVLASIDQLVAADRLVEVRLLVVPGLNDDPDLLARTGAYLADHAPGVPVRVLGFRPHGVRHGAHGLQHAEAPDAARREAYRDIVAAAHGDALVTCV
jgi:pyruvate-formate lyase-activating enzyme